MSTINLASPAQPASLARLPFTSNEVLWIAIATFLLPIVIVEYNVLQFTGGIFSYPVDDAFIHLAIAKNLAYYHVWGISPHGFVSASSSVLYPLLLTAVVKLFGAKAIIPFVINLLAAIAFLYVLQRWLIRQQLTVVAQLLILLAVIMLIPLPVIAMSGMEHTLQLLFCFLFITRFSEEIGRLVGQSQEASLKKEWSFSWTVYLYGALLTATRYEGIMLIGIACLILVFYRQWYLAFQLGLLCLLPILIFGIYSIFQGSYFIPNSVLLKSGAPPLTFGGLLQFFSVEIYNRLSFSTSGYKTVAIQRMLFILPLSYLLFRHSIRKDLNYAYLLILLTAICCLHLLLTGRGSFPRYEAYLIGVGTAVTGALFAKYGCEVLREVFAQARWIAIFAAIILVIPVVMRSVEAFTIVDRATINIYQQQYQMGRFLGKYYHDTPIAFNDIGAVSYFTQGKNLDFAGLGNLDMARSMKNFYATPDFLYKISQRDSVQIAVIAEKFYSPALLQRWNKVASWQITSGNVICLDDSVSFFAVKNEARQELEKNLHAFESSLPKGVAVHYY